MKPIRLLLLAALMLAAAPSVATASKTQESMFQDDPLLVYAPQAKMEATLDELKAIGVDRIRVGLFWNIVAPASTSPTKPSFDASDPAAYGSGWERYDRLIVAARQRGIAINLNVSSPLPRWGSTAVSPRADVQKTYAPNADEFGKFVAAAGKRYSGSFQGLPRVNYWSIYNEPNQSGWLTPQWNGAVESSPTIYRSLVRTSYQALGATGHGRDTILIGETAPKGLKRRKGLTMSIDALRFIRNLYCVDSKVRQLKGASARARGCPVSRAQFVTENPALFKTTGFAHHPYELLLAPTRKPQSKDWVTIANLPVLSRLLKRIYSRYRQKRQSSKGVPLYLTEYGYQTPPDPLGIPFGRQASYQSQAEQISYRNPLVRAMCQFLLVDDAPTPGIANRRVAYRTFQSGLKRLNGKRKPAYQAYVTPLFLTKTRFRGAGSTSVFGLLRPASSTAKVTVQIQFRARGAKAWSTRKTRTVSGPRHYLRTPLRVTRTGAVRLRWKNGTSQVTSRAVSVSKR